MSFRHADRIESSMHLFGAVAGARAVAAWKRAGARQDAARAQQIVNARAAADAVATVERTEVAKLRGDLMKLRVLVAREQSTVDAREAKLAGTSCPAPRLPMPTPEATVASLSVALVWSRAELLSLEEEILDLQDEAEVLQAA